MPNKQNPLQQDQEQQQDEGNGSVWCFVRLTSPRRILQQPPIHLRLGQDHIPHHTAPDEHVLDGRQVRVLVEVEDVDVVQLDVEVLVDGFEGAADADVVLELDGDDVVGEGFEETEQKRVLAGIIQVKDIGSRGSVT